MDARMRTMAALGAVLAAVSRPAFSSGVPATGLDEVVVTAGRIALAGSPRAASEGTVFAEQLENRPLLRVGELLEVVPGLIVTQHTGDGKANQYFLRGFNLDHGTDFATRVQGMPVNMPTHGHGQGYMDVNFVIPELVERVDYRKGTYYPEQGNFSAAGAADIRYRDSTLPFVSLTGGDNGYARAVAAGSTATAGGKLLAGFEHDRGDGPWQLPQDLRKTNGILRWSRDGDSSGLGIDLMGYRGQWRATDQIPRRAVLDGSLDRFGFVDPTNGGESQRYSLSAQGFKRWDGPQLDYVAYAMDYRLQLFSNITYALDRENGDQFEQLDDRAQGVGQSSAAAIEERFVFETWNKQQVDAFRGSFMVPENRAARGSREIPIKYVRLPATGGQARPPIVYLAGGPGGSGIQAINYRYQMFMAMRKHGDVIALDQRGTGDSNIVPECQSAQTVPATTATTDRRFAEYIRDALRECLAFWRQEDVDLAGYNTVQSAQDLEALRRHIGAEKIVLWGTSYGSHLALAALREMPGRIDRVVVSSVEGLNQTIKLPARSDEYFDRLQAAIDTQPEAKAAYPDIKALIRRVHAKLEREPVHIQLKSRDGSKFDYLLQSRDMQMLAAGLIADPSSAAQLLAVYQAIEQGGEAPLDQIPARLLPDHLVAAGKPIKFEAMPVAMDIASGMTADRRREVSHQATQAILGNYLDPALLFDGLAPELDLGDAFRAGPVSDAPVLALSGTLDGRTTIDSQREALSGLTNVTMITVKGAGHNLFDEDAAAIQEAIDLFLEGNSVPAGAIEVELPNMAAERSLDSNR